MPFFDPVWYANLACQFSKGNGPILGSRRQLSGEFVGRPYLERSHELLSKHASVHRGFGGDQSKIDQVSYTRTMFPNASVCPSVCMNLLGDVTRKWNPRNLDSLDLCEVKKFGAVQSVWTI